MKLEVKPCSKNQYPVEGLLIEGDHLHFWLQQLQRLHINLEAIKVFALPGITPNSVWGCFVAIAKKEIDLQQLERVTLCQCVHHKLYIPQFAQLYPHIHVDEIDKLFPHHQHILHPAFGLFALDTPIDFAGLLTLPSPAELIIQSAVAASFIPRQIRNMHIVALTPEESLKVMEQQMFPEKKSFPDEPLNWKEKIKLNILRKLVSAKDSENGSSINESEKSALLKMLEKLMPGKNLGENMQQELSELERRNNSEMEKLMDLLKRDPDEALKYAIPLDTDGTNRGGDMGSFQMSKRWGSFNLFGNSSAGSGNSIFADDSFQRLQQQYYKTAQDLVAEQKYDKAAFVYMKLLKNNPMAAKTLEDGKMYSEAASVYLKYLENKNKAAECYEKGYMTSEAIELYKELQQKEKVGDLYTVLNRKTDAYLYYNEVVADYTAEEKFVKASLLLKQKMDNKVAAQHLLIQGWRENKDAFNCLNNYFSNIEDPKKLHESVDAVYYNDTDKKNKASFLKVLSIEQKKDALLQAKATQMAYEIVAELAESQPDIVHDLALFNKDRSLNKDVIRFKSEVNSKSKKSIA